MSLPTILLEAQSGQVSGAPGSFLGVVLYFGVLFAIMWFILIRPQRKRQKAIDEMQSSVSVGDWVMTSGGIFGKVVDTVNDICIVEFGLNRGTRIPVQRDQIAAIKEPDLTVKKYDEDVEEEETEEDEEE
ncbi:MAG: preprotein translocase subunit YajC [Epulopiscium sp.]|nr:preprotein translocase subunit YajC [Candidatus Epulonipiscium sp.]